MHKWTKEDDKAALIIFLVGDMKREADIIAKSRGISSDSFRMKVQNFEYLASNGEKGLANYSSQSKMVWDEFLDKLDKYRKKRPL
jgi:hypothetical protein